ncbi:MAG: diguanylate cyclase response regulator [Sulfurospirillum sp.]|nr:MAG: diguanylate cyclase response regulator [Sulfurospirillum sp.]
MNILLVEHNSTLATILKNELLKVLNFNICIDIAYSLQDARVSIGKKDYTLSIASTNIPGSSPQNITDFFANENIPTILMVNSINSKLKTLIKNHNIIDYIIKNRSEAIDYLVHYVDRLLKNRHHTALVVDNSSKNRKNVVKILNQQMINTIEASDATTAMDIIRRDPHISIVMTDYEMPEANGLELVLAIRKTYKKYELPIIGISSIKEHAINFLKYGVNDFIRKPIFKEELKTRVNNTLDSIENIQKLNNYANTDYLTGIANRKYFFANARGYLAKNRLTDEPFAVAMVDIDNFKQINDTYGHDIGDKVIKKLANFIKDNIKGQDIVARFGGEEFCILLKNIQPSIAHKFLDSLRQQIASLSIEIKDEKPLQFSVSIGLATKKEIHFDKMIKQSDLLLYEAKESGKNRVCSDLKEMALV